MNKPLHRSKTRLQGESLELRKMLDASGALWNLDADQYTISFADDGTNVGPKQSSLYTELAHLGAPEVWQEAILRGFQTWARHTNVDLIVVDDEARTSVLGGTPMAILALAIFELRRSRSETTYHHMLFQRISRTLERGPGISYSTQMFTSKRSTIFMSSRFTKRGTCSVSSIPRILTHQCLG